MSEEPLQPPPPTAPVPNAMSDERTWSLMAHLSALAGLLGVPLGHVLGPLVVWLVKKDQSAVVAAHAKEALNFQITVTIAGLVCIPLIFVCVGIPMLIALAMADLV